MVKVLNQVDWNRVDSASNAPDRHWGDSDEPKSLDAFKREPDGSGHGQQASKACPLVLVADDDPMIRLLAQQALDSRSFKVLPAENGKDALEIFEASTPDLILCDIRMPRAIGTRCTFTMYIELPFLSINNMCFQFAGIV